jgi:hypothetical protein
LYQNDLLCGGNVENSSIVLFHIPRFTVMPIVHHEDKATFGKTNRAVYWYNLFLGLGQAHDKAPASLRSNGWEQRIINEIKLILKHYKV